MYIIFIIDIYYVVIEEDKYFIMIFKVSVIYIYIVKKQVLSRLRPRSSLVFHTQKSGTKRALIHFLFSLKWALLFDFLA